MSPLEIPTSTLSDGHEEEISVQIPPETLSVGETGVVWGGDAAEGAADLHFPSPIRIEGRLYAADDHYVLEFEVETIASLPCSICNRWVEQQLHLSGVRVVREASRFPSGVWEISSDVREAILLEVPHLAECSGGCPMREELKEYLDRKPSEGGGPFADL